MGSRELRDAHVPYDNTGGNRSAFAVCSVSSNTLQVTRYSAQGTLQEQKTVDLSSLNQQALYVHEMFPASTDTAGFLTISGTAVFWLARDECQRFQMVGFGWAPGRLRTANRSTQYGEPAYEIDFRRTVYPWGIGNWLRRDQLRHRGNNLSCFRWDDPVSPYAFVAFEWADCNGCRHGEDIGSQIPGHSGDRNARQRGRYDTGRRQFSSLCAPFCAVLT